MQNTQRPLMIVGLAWYDESDFQRLREMFEDGDALPRTYGEWLKAAMRGLEHEKAKGYHVEKVHIRPNEFSAWCKSNCLSMNAKARISYANEVVSRMYLRRKDENLN